jgi:signal transduction histidine kinase
MASHEFRTPLTTIVSSADLLENRPDDASNSQKAFLKIQACAA